MQLGPRNAWLVATIGIVAVVTAIATGVALRLEDPLSSSTIPAEDPYTHMALVREHLRDGSLDPLYEPGSLYPPGMHTFLAAAWVFTGSDLYEIFRFGPVVFGGVGILGMAALLWRHAGPVASFVGAMAYAVAPETIFRTTMMSPTAMDMALVPFLFMGYLAVLTGRLAWIPATAALSAFLVFAHPWLFALFALTGLVFLVYMMVFPWRQSDGTSVHPLGFASVVAILAGSVILTLTTGPGFFRTIRVLPDAAWGVPIPLLTFAVVLPLALVPFVLYRFAPRFYGRLVDAPTRDRPSLLRRAAGSAAMAAILVAVTVPAVRQGMPELVDLPRMFGWPILTLAAAGFVALPFVARPLPNLAAAFATVTYPLVIYNPLQSPFWPHRTAAFCGIALVILTGIAASAVTRLAIRASTAMADRRAMGGASARPAMMMAIPALLLAPALGGGVFAGTPVSYDGWYRLYGECEMDAFEEMAAIGEAHPDAVFVTGSYQSKLMLGALAPDSSRMWMMQSFYLGQDGRQENLDYFLKDDIPVYVVVDIYLRQETPDADTGFLHEDPWMHAGEWCHGTGGRDEARLTLYTLEPTHPDGQPVGPQEVQA